MALPGSPLAYNVAPGQSQADLDYKRKIAYALMMQGMDASPVQAWTQGLARMAQGALGGYEMYKAESEDEADRAKARDIISALMPGNSNVPSAPQADASAPTPAPAPASTEPRGIRNNNPLNIEAGRFAMGQPGFSGSDGRFAKFASLDQGMGAANALMDTYKSKYGLNTVRSIVSRWAPESENDTAGYIASVAGKLGVDPDQPLTSEQRPALIQAMGQFENGKPLPRMAQAGPPVAPIAPPNGPPGQAPVGAPIDQPRGGLTDNRRQQLISALAQTKAGAPIAQALFAKELEREATRARPLTEEEKKVYPGAVAIKAGGEPIFPPPSTNVSLNAQNTAESTYAKGKAEDALGLERSADKTVEERQRIEVFKNLVQNFQTGKLGPAQVTVGAWADALGIDPKVLDKFGIQPNAAVNGQLIEQLGNSMTLGMIGNKAGEGGMPANNFSDADRKFLAKTVPSLANTPGANQIMLEMKSRALDRHLEKVSMWDKYRADGKSYESFERDWRKYVNTQPSLFADIPDRIKQMAPPAAPASGAPAAPGSAPDRAAIEQEMRRRGLLK